MRLRSKAATTLLVMLAVLALGAGATTAAVAPPTVRINAGGGYFSLGSTIAPDMSVPVTYRWTINAPGEVCRVRSSVTDGQGGVYGGFDVNRSVPMSLTYQDPAWGSYDNGIPGLRVAVEVTDCLGQVGETSTTGQVYIWDEARATYSQGWATGSCQCWYGGTIRRSTAAKQTATFSATGSGFALVGVTGPGRGTADIYVDGRKVRSVNTAAARTTNRVVIFQTHFNSVKRHTIRVVVAKGRVDLDALLISQPPGSRPR